MRAIFRSVYIVVLLGLMNASYCSSASAIDLEMLTRLLVPAYMAFNFAQLCSDQDGPPSTEPNVRLSLARDFAEQVKQEVTIGLPESQAAQVRVMAADAAREVARNQMKRIGAQGRFVSPEALKDWCERSGTYYIADIMKQHKEKHQEFDRLVEAAKR